MSELEYLKNRSILIIEFILSKNEGDQMLQQFKSVIHDTYTKENIKGLKMISRDVNAWAKGLPQNDIKELESILKKKFGENLTGDKVTNLVIKQVLRKGCIENDDDYRVVYEYLQDISETDQFYESLEALKKLLKSE